MIRASGFLLAVLLAGGASAQTSRTFGSVVFPGGTHATMEVSSHALELGRVYGLQFHTVVFTNLTRDHLDFHGDMEAYFAAKQRLFEGAGGPPPRFAVLNHDDEYGRAVKTKPGTEVLSYGIEKGASLRAVRINTGFQ